MPAKDPLSSTPMSPSFSTESDRLALGKFIVTLLTGVGMLDSSSDASIKRQFGGMSSGAIDTRQALAVLEASGVKPPLPSSSEEEVLAAAGKSVPTIDALSTEPSFGGGPSQKEKSEQQLMAFLVRLLRNAQGGG